MKDTDNKLKYKASIEVGKEIFLENTLKFLEESKCLFPNDCLTIVCKLIKFAVKYGDKLEKDNVPCSRLEELSSDLSDLFSTKENSDVILLVEGQEIPAHSIILSARSSYFSTMFKNDMEERRSRKIDITDFGVTAINNLLRYLYTGSMENLKDLPDDVLTELYTAADKYDVKGLKDMCTQIMASNLFEKNAEAYAMLAFSHDEQTLRDAVVNFFSL